MQKSDSKQTLQGRTAVVDKKFKNLQWSLHELVSQSSADTDRCIQKGMGCSMSRDINRGKWLKEEQLLNINVLELKAIKLALLTFNKQKSLKGSSFSNRQLHCTILPCENGRNREPNVTEIKQKN